MLRGMSLKEYRIKTATQWKLKDLEDCQGVELGLKLKYIR